VRKQLRRCREDAFADGPRSLAAFQHVHDVSRRDLANFHRADLRAKHVFQIPLSVIDRPVSERRFQRLVFEVIDQIRDVPRGNRSDLFGALLSGWIVPGIYCGAMRARGLCVVTTACLRDFYAPIPTFVAPFTSISLISTLS
jgi:hypothetical protein